MTSPGPFALLLAAAQRGEGWACTELWRTYAPAVAGYARARGSVEVEDLTSEVFLAVFRGLAGFVGDEAAFRSYLFTIAHRRVVDELRARARAGNHTVWSEEMDPRLVESAEEQALTWRNADHVRGLLDTLAPDQREVLLLRIFGDLTVERVAQLVGKRPGAVKALQRRGLQALRKKVDHGEVPWVLETEGRERDGWAGVV